MAESFKNLSLAKLQRMQARLAKEIQRRSQDVKKKVLREVQQIAKKHGLSIESLLGGAPAAGKAAGKPRNSKAGKSTKGRKVPVKYRHPKNKDLAWTGRGRKPKWVEEWLSGGGTMEQLAV